MLRDGDLAQRDREHVPGLPFFNDLPEVRCEAGSIVENWRQLPDGQIEFTTRRPPTAD